MLKKIIALALSLLVLSTSADLSAKHCDKGRGRGGVRAAQANYQDEATFVPTVDAPIPFTVSNFRTNVNVNAEGTVFEVRVPGLYSIDAFLLLNIPNIGETVTGFITINGRKLLTFLETATRTSSPVVGFHFEDRLVYLEEGDKVSVVLSDFTPGTTVLARGFVMVALNNSR